MAIQDYEKVWSGYAERFVKNSDAKRDGWLGEEWGTAEQAEGLFTKYLEPCLSSKSTVAELGVGGGKYSAMVAPRVQVLYGIDISIEMLNLTEARLRDLKCAFVPVKTDGKHVALDDNSVDLFFSFDSMVHIFPYDLFAYLCEMQRFLRPGGKAIFEFADWDSTGLVQKFLLDYNAYIQQGQLSSGAFGFISRSAICRLSEHAGLQVESLEQITGRTTVIVLKK
jgi:SAM-dependent methyltransferase